MPCVVRARREFVDEDLARLRLEHLDGHDADAAHRSDGFETNPPGLFCRRFSDLGWYDDGVAAVVALLGVRERVCHVRSVGVAGDEYGQFLPEADPRFDERAVVVGQVIPRRAEIVGRAGGGVAVAVVRATILFDDNGVAKALGRSEGVVEGRTAAEIGDGEAGVAERPLLQPFVADEAKRLGRGP